MIVPPDEHGDNFAGPGDIGTYIVNSDNMVVGMVIGFGDGYTYATPSADILRFLREVGVEEAG